MAEQLPSRGDALISLTLISNSKLNLDVSKLVPRAGDSEVQDISARAA